MTFVFWWPILYGLVLLGVLVLWVKTDNRNQKTEVRKARAPFFLSRYGIRRTPVPGGGTPGAHAQCLPAGRRDRVAEAMWRATLS